MSIPESLSPTEQRAYDLITARDRLPQSALWKALDVTSRAGSRLATSLAEKASLNANG